MTALAHYRRFVWWTMEGFGVDDSLGGKLLLAAAVQFAVSVAQAVIPTVFSGLLRIEATLVGFVLAAVAFGTTVLIAREEIVRPIERLEAAASRIADGEVAVDLPETDQRDEVGALVDAFGEMQATLETTAEQADALAASQFDAPVLDEQIPGRFGRTLDQMTRGLQRHIERIESDRDQFRLLNHLVCHDVPNLLNVADGRLGLARERADPHVAEQLDVVAEQLDEIESITTTVSRLANEATVERVDLVDVLRDRANHVRNSFPEATVETHLPGKSVDVWGNDLLVTVFENLLSNGVEHDDSDDPHVTVTLEVDDSDPQVDDGDPQVDDGRPTDDTAQADGRWATVTVADDGPGIEVPSDAGLFEQLDPGTGLHIVHTVVGRFGGEIDLVETGPAGTTFRVRFPIADPEREKPEETVRRLSART